MKRGEISISDYEREAAGKLKPADFNASDWVSIAKKGGMKFVVATAKHHDGFAMYKSSNPYNLVDFAGFNRDIMKELSVECKKQDLGLGFYYSQSQDWHEEGAVGNDWDFPKTQPQENFDAYFNSKVVPQVTELAENYDDLFMFWFDTPVRMKDKHCEKLMNIIAEKQPSTLVNSRLGNGYGHFDVSLDNGRTPAVCTSAWLEDLKIPWQTHASVSKSWGYTKYAAELDRTDDYTSFIYNLCNIVSHGGVYLLNVAPRPDGTIPQTQVNSLTAIGDWLEVNGEAIYGTDPSPLKFPPYAITSKPGKLYLHIKNFDNNNVELTGILSKVKKAYSLADKTKTALKFKQKKEKISISVPKKFKQPRVTVIVLDIADEKVKVVDETIQVGKDGIVDLPISKCEYAIRRIGYDYEREVTHRWGENTKQGLIWTVDVKKAGKYKVISEQTGDNKFEYELSLQGEHLILNAKGDKEMSKKEQQGTISINKPGRITITVYPKVRIKKRHYEFKGLELVPVN